MLFSDFPHRSHPDKGVYRFSQRGAGAIHVEKNYEREEREERGIEGVGGLGGLDATCVGLHLLRLTKPYQHPL